MADVLASMLFHLDETSRVGLFWLGCVGLVGFHVYTDSLGVEGVVLRCIYAFTMWKR
jgi:hypothetical protein